MDYKKINVNKLILKKSYNNNLNVLYNNQKLSFLTPELVCESDIIEESKNKFYFFINIKNSDFLTKFLLNVENFLKEKKNDIQKIFNISDNIEFVNFIKSNFELKIKIPYRYRKFEVDFYNSQNVYITSNKCIKKNNNIICHLELSNVWVFNNFYSCLWIVKKITKL